MITMELAEHNAEIFFIDRFSKEKLDYVKQHKYFKKWVDRFLFGEPEEFMDSESLEIYGKLILNGEISWSAEEKKH